MPDECIRLCAVDGSHEKSFESLIFPMLIFPSLRTTSAAECRMIVRHSVPWGGEILHEKQNRVSAISDRFPALFCLPVVTKQQCTVLENKFERLSLELGL